MKFSCVQLQTEIAPREAVRKSFQHETATIDRHQVLIIGDPKFHFLITRSSY